MGPTEQARLRAHESYSFTHYNYYNMINTYKSVLDKHL